VALSAVGRYGEAEQMLREAFAARHSLAAAHPGVAVHQRELAETHHAFGDLLCATGRWAAAEQAYRAALAVRAKLQAAGVGGWPGCDGLTLDGVLDCYP
jgi:hypothetical protein